MLDGEWSTIPEIVRSISDLKNPQSAIDTVNRLPTPQRIALSDALNYSFDRAPNHTSVREAVDLFWQIRIAELENEPKIGLIRQKCREQKLQVQWECRQISSTKPDFLQFADLKVGEIAITFDDGPHPISTPLVLQALRQSDVRCNFFQLGETARKSPLISRAVADAGHAVGSHSMSHPDLTKLPIEEALKNIRDGREQIATSSGQSKPFFRCPYGEVNQELRQMIFAEGLFIFHWAMDPQEWDFKKTQFRLTKTFDAIVSEIERARRGILLLHDVQRQVGLTLPDVLNYLALNEYKIVQFV